MRARLVLETVERHMREAGAEVTIRALWVALADRAVGGEADVRAAAGLAGMAGMAMGLRSG